MNRLPRLSIFARTFVMMFIALLVSVAIGYAVLNLRPPTTPNMVSLFELAAALQPGHSPFAGHGPDGHGGLPPPSDAGAMPDGRNPAGAPPGEPPGMPQGPAFGSGPGGNGDMDVATSASAPAPPARFDAKVSSRMLMRLSAVFNVPAAHLRVYVPTSALVGGHGPMGNELGPGFVIALRQDDGSWRVASLAVEAFPTALQVQLAWLFALGLLVLLPLAWLFARALSAPIQRFAQAAQRLGSDTSAPPVPREGPREMRQAVDAFNAMQARINRLLQERTHMIGAIAHDLRTPLTRLSFRLDGLSSPLNEKVEADIQEMKSMISAALDFIRDRSLGVHRELLDFRLLVESVADDMADVGHEVTLQDGSAITMHGDPLALRRAVVNLVENGLKYGERVRMRMRTTGAECVLEIDDDGPGIADAMQSQVFEPFFRLEASRNRDTGGIGLGLATVRAIVLDHGGSIALRNRKDGGLRVALTLPLGQGL